MHISFCFLGKYIYIEPQNLAQHIKVRWTHLINSFNVVGMIGLFDTLKYYIGISMLHYFRAVYIMSR